MQETTEDRWLEDQPYAGDVTSRNAAHHRKLTVKEPPAGSLKALSSAVQQAAIANVFIRPRPRGPEEQCCMLKGMKSRKQVRTQKACVFRAEIQTACYLVSITLNFKVNNFLFLNIYNYGALLLFPFSCSDPDSDSDSNVGPDQISPNDRGCNCTI